MCLTHRDTFMVCRLVRYGSLGYIGTAEIRSGRTGLGAQWPVEWVQCCPVILLTVVSTTSLVSCASCNMAFILVSGTKRAMCTVPSFSTYSKSDPVICDDVRIRSRFCAAQSASALLSVSYTMRRQLVETAAQASARGRDLLPVPSGAFFR